MARTGFFQTLDRLGLLKYVLAALFTVSACALTAGAFLVDTWAKRPAKPKTAPAAWLRPERPATPPGWTMRAPVAHTARYTAVNDRPAGFAFYDITAQDTPQTLAAKLGRKHFQIGRGRGEICDFAAPLTGRHAPGAAVARFIRERGQDCCHMAQALPHQLSTYVFGQDGATNGPITGTAVFSTVSGGLLTLTLRFTDKIDGYASAVSRYLREHCGQPLPGDGSTWARDGGLVTIARQGHTLVVTAYYAANIERHAAQTREMAARQPAPEPRAGGRLAMVDAP